MFHLAITRRHLLQSAALAALVPVPGIVEQARAQTAPDGLVWRHALSMFGDVKYPADFKHYDYVNPAAPKGGVVRMFEHGTFDNFNIVVNGVKGSLADGVNQILETLTT